MHATEIINALKFPELISTRSINLFKKERITKCVPRMNKVPWERIVISRFSLKCLNRLANPKKAAAAAIYVKR